VGTILGLDAGGTFTDSVIIDARTKSVLHKAKTLTTHDDLTRCLGSAFGGLPQGLARSISMVCLSTTLATNAVVEGRGCREGLVLIGSKPRGTLPSSRQLLIQGRYDLKGRVIEHLDPAQVLRTVDSLRGSVDAVAVSGYASVRNPEHELYVKAVVEDRLGVPVVCAHELTSQLGYYERTVTAALNAKLIPMIWDLTDSVQAVMRRFAVDAPLMIVRGDGTLMPDGVARTKPIETVLSGPAASAIGAVHLSGRSDCLVMDIGGTTTDIAHVSAGRLTTRADGAQVGDWRTQVRAAEVFTVGLGGDSRIFVDAGADLRIGPGRSLGYAMAAREHPHLEDELVEILSTSAHRRFLRPDHEAYVLARQVEEPTATDDERVVIQALLRGPHTLFHLLRTTELDGLPAILAGLVRDGVAQRISLTPTDVWHVTGQYRPGSIRAAALGLQITGEMINLGSDEFLEMLRRTLRRQLDSTVARAALYTDRQDSVLAANKVTDYFFGRLYLDGGTSVLRASYEIMKPVVAIGGPAATWLGVPDESALFVHEVPEHADVANAVGAALAHAVERVEVLIRKDTVSGQYLVFSPVGKRSLPTLEEATGSASEGGKEFLERVLGVPIVQPETEIRDVHIGGVSWAGDPFIERVVTVVARQQNALGAVDSN